ncbi:putative inactive peptidyl-prolyl cis-trans isomerase-like 6 isoform X7 [Callithrix jacchus]|uniref:probable inactive peptidyl-prolyl cis-trans isomerase-like 6 isoform X8 n=1 Tax=Callithrix jacchus TaxID=9483 RepID=UPI0001D3688A|nr:probable inactive peptidyl-prolyl cis-trans isomerase-like 6 isoform X8 [Callithrix jacchus]
MGSPQPCRPQHARCGSPLLPERPLQVKVVGLFSCPKFQIAKSAAENLKNNHPSKFEDPVLVPLQEFAWHQYLQEKKRELKNETWEYSSSVMSFVNGQLLGDALDLQKWAHEVWDIVDVKPSALYDALAEDFSTKFLRDTKHNFVFLDICIDSSPIGRLIFELYCDVCPKTCKNFQVLCTGKAGFSQSGIRLHYKDSVFHRIVPNGWIQGGDIVSGKGDNGESIYGPTFEELYGSLERTVKRKKKSRGVGKIKKYRDENFSVPHNKRGVLGMANKGRHSNGSQFYITLQATPYLDRKFVAFGQLIEGTEVLKQLELVPTQNERPIPMCRIIDSGDPYA